MKYQEAIEGWDKRKAEARYGLLTSKVAAENDEQSAFVVNTVLSRFNQTELVKLVYELDYEGRSALEDAQIVKAYLLTNFKVTVDPES
jgi:hypothetical protein